jgi:glycosyltransferase involved in cell wall biosynthesis
MTAPLVSVIIPCYRQARYLPQALRSVFRQSYPAIEIVVVNDGSDDDTEAVARAHADRIRYVRQSNRGLPEARNAGIREAAGRYLLFLDADDLLRRDAVAWLVGAMEGRDDRLCFLGFRTFDSEAPACGQTQRVRPYAGPLAARLLRENLAPVHAWLCPHERVRAAGGFEPGLAACEDWDLWLRLALAGADVVAVPRVGAYYRRYPGSMSSDPVRMARARAAVLERARRRLRETPEFCRRWQVDPGDADQALRRDIRDELLDAAYLLRQARDYRGAFCDYLGSLRRGTWSGTAVLGIAKLLPHRLLTARPESTKGVAS